MFLHFQSKIQKICSCFFGRWSQREKAYVLIKCKWINYANKVYNQLIIMSKNIILHYF